MTILGDTAVEPNETFTVQLSNPSANATIIDGTAVGTITDDDAGARVRVSIDHAEVVEGPIGATAKLRFTPRSQNLAFGSGEWSRNSSKVVAGTSRMS